MTQTHVNVKTLQKIRECPEKIKYGTLGSNDAGSCKNLFLYRCLDLLKSTMLKKRSIKEWEQDLTCLFRQEYSPDWFDLKQSCEQERKNDFCRMFRLGSYLLSLPVTRCIADAPYHAELPYTLICHGTEFSAISGKADLILFYQNGVTEVLCFDLSQPKYSHNARTEVNHVAYALELLALKLGFETRYPHFRASLFYLKNKDDKEGKLEPYEHRRGKNIISSSFENTDILASFEKALTLPAEKNCKICRYESLCRTVPIPSKYASPQSGTQRQEKKTELRPKPSFTEAQNTVIYHKEGPMNCIAVPGAGKTTCLVHRMLFLIKEGIKPRHILFVTFTQKAAQEIRERVKRELKLEYGNRGEKDLPAIYTFNGLGYQILKENPVILGRRVKLASRIDRLRLIREILNEVEIHGMSYSGIYLPYGMIPTLERYFEKIETSGAEAFRKSFRGKDPEGVLMAYRKYQEAFQKQELVTYDMQVSLCNQLFLENPELAAVYARIFRYIMVDEFQDVSADNAQMIYTIAKYHNNLVVVGDDDQAVYGFRGGSNHHMLHFSEDFPSARTVMMEDNFRSGQGILQVASGVIEKNAERFQKKLISHQNDGPCPMLLQEFQDNHLSMLVEHIKRMGYKYEDIAILARYNKTLQKAKVCLSPGIQCTNPKDYVINDSAFTAIADVLELSYCGMEDMPLYRLFKIQGIDLKQKIQIKRRIIDCLYASDIPVNNIPNSELIQKSLSGELQEAMAHICTAVKGVKQAKTMPELINGIIREIFRSDYHPVSPILECLCDERAISDGKELLLLMRDMILFSDQTRIKYEYRPDEVRLLTAHDSKGMEFPVVILFSLDEFDDTEEERRLLYVAFTRAKQLLVITRSPHVIAKLLPDINCNHLQEVTDGIDLWK